MLAKHYEERIKVCNQHEHYSWQKTILMNEYINELWFLIELNMLNGI